MLLVRAKNGKEYRQMLQEFRQEGSNTYLLVGPVISMILWKLPDITNFNLMRKNGLAIYLLH